MLKAACSFLKQVESASYALLVGQRLGRSECSIHGSEIEKDAEAFIA